MSVIESVTKRQRGQVKPGTRLQLKPEDIILDPDVQARWQPDGVVDELHVIDLAQNIKKEGQYSDVRIWQDPKAGFAFVASFGHHRIKAIKWLRENDPDCKDMLVGCVVGDENNKRSAFLVSMFENLKRQDYSPMDYATIIAKLREGAGKEKWDWKDIVDQFGNKKTVQWAKNMYRLFDYPRPVQDAVHRGLSYTAVLALDPKILKTDEEWSQALAMAQADSTKNLKGADLSTYENDPNIIKAKELQDAVANVARESSEESPRIITLKESAPGVVEMEYRHVTRVAIRTVNPAVKKGQNRYGDPVILAIPEDKQTGGTITIHPNDHKKPLGTQISVLPHGYKDDSGNVKIGVAVDLKLSAPETPRVETPRPPDGNTATDNKSATPESGTPGTPTQTGETPVAPPTQTNDQTPKLPGSVSVGTVRKFDDLKPLMDRIAQRYGGNDPASKLAATIISYHLVKDTGEDKVVMAVNDLRDFVSPERQAEFKADCTKPIVLALNDALAEVDRLKVALDTAIAERDTVAAKVATHGKK